MLVAGSSAIVRPLHTSQGMAPPGYAFPAEEITLTCSLFVHILWYPVQVARCAEPVGDGRGGTPELSGEPLHAYVECDRVEFRVLIVDPPCDGYAVQSIGPRPRWT